jgi:WD40 repeat protein
MMTSSSAQPALLNPYVGPRSFTRGEAIYGRDREIQRLLHLLIAERIVVLYSPSGAGKTSLIQAGLIPRLEGEAFAVLPVVRVGLEPPDLALGSRGSQAAPNRYVQSVILSLEEGQPPEQRVPLAELADMDLVTYLDRRCTSAQNPETTEWVLVFDQFEEILTVNPTDETEKSEFFGQVGAALRDRRFWALFALREDYLAGLDPYLRPIPTRLHTTFRLDLLGPEAARVAIQQPAQAAGVDFEDAAAERLIDDLRRVRIQQLDGTMLDQLGPYVEPVQLQVVCRRLWDRLPAGTSRIVENDIEAVGDVDQALAGYYAERVAAVASHTGVGERTIREWIDRHLITEQAIRGQVLQGPDQSEGLPNSAILALVDAHLVRAERRRGFTWFELAHDRLIAPVRADNAAWFELNLSELQRTAALWEQQDRPAGMLLHDQALAEAERWSATHEGELIPVELDFLETCRQAHAVVLRDRRRVTWIQRLAVGALLLAILASGASALAFLAENDALHQRDEAQHAQATAVAETAVANQRGLVGEARDNYRGHLDLGLLLSLAAIRTADSPEAEGALLDGLNFDPRLARFLSPVDGHAGRARGLGFTSDDRLVSVSDEIVGQQVTNNVVYQQLRTTLRVWDVASAAQQGPEMTYAGGTRAFAVSPNRNLVATVDISGRILVWDINTRTSPPSRVEPKQPVDSLAFNNDGTVLAAGGCSSSEQPCADGQISIWTVANSQLVQPQSQLPLQVSGSHGVTSLAFSPDGKSLAAGGADGKVRQWTVADWTQRGEAVSGNGLPVKTLAFDPTDNYVAFGTDNPDVYYYRPNLAPGQPQKASLLRGPSLAINSVAFDPVSDNEGTQRVRLAAASSDGRIFVWYLPGGQQANPPPLVGHTADIWNVAFSPNGTMLASAGTDGVIRLWHTPRIDSEFTKSQEPLGTRLPSPKSGLGVRRVAFSPDGEKLAGILTNNSLGVWNFADRDSDGKPSTSDLSQGRGRIRAVAFSADGSLLATAGCAGTAPCNAGSLRFWNAATNEPDGSPLTVSGSELMSLAFSPDVNVHRLITGGADGNIRVWDYTSRSEVGESGAPQGASSPVDSLAVSPDGAVVAAARADGSVELWDSAGRDRTAVLEDANGAIGVNNLTFNPDGTLLAGACNVATCGPGKLFVWNVATHDLSPQPPTGQVGIVNDVAFTGPTALAAVSADGTLQLWDVANGKPYGEPLFAYPFALDGVAFNATRGLLATSSGTTYSGNAVLDEKVVVWRVRLSDWTDLACGIANRNLSMAEWTRIVGVDKTYTSLCPGLPPGPGVAQ